jgi:ubiquinol-cytochrome c reductase cytochrome b/c1 subunit
MISLSRSLVLALAFAGGLSLTPALAVGGGEKPPRQTWSFAGPFGTFDKAQLQRGFKVYREVCASCHGLEKLSLRNLSQPGGPGFTDGQVRTLAAEYKVQDGPNEQGEMFERPGRPADRFPKPFPNVETAKAANNGAVPPDFSVIAKARTYERGFPVYVFDIFTQYQQQGVDYITALLLGYEAPPEGTVVEDGLHWNKYFPGNKIAMSNPLVVLFDDAGKPQDAGFYTDGTPVTKLQVAKDISAFLMWAAEPKMEERKRMGVQVMLWLILLAGLLFMLKKRIWSRLDEEPAKAH